MRVEYALGGWWLGEEPASERWLKALFPVEVGVITWAISQAKGMPLHLYRADLAADAAAEFAWGARPSPDLPAVQVSTVEFERSFSVEVPEPDGWDGAGIPAGGVG